MKTPACHFDAASHSYTINGRPVPSVTSVLGDLIPGWKASDWYLQRGSAVHAVAALIANGKTFVHDPQIDGQVSALRKFFRETGVTPLAVEFPVFSERYQYAGTLDLLAFWANEKTVIDFKASLTPSVPYQLGAYALAYDDSPNSGRTPIRFGLGVEIQEDGNYRLSEVFNLKRYQAEWLALLTTYNVRRRCGVKETKEEGEG